MLMLYSIKVCLVVRVNLRNYSFDLEDSFCFAKFIHQGRLKAILLYTVAKTGELESILELCEEIIKWNVIKCITFSSYYIQF